MKKSVLLILILALPATAFATDLSITYKLKGGDAKEKSVYWSDQFQLTSFKGGGLEDQLFDYSQNTVYTINHRTKVITYIKMDEMGSMMESMVPMMNQAMGMEMPGGKGTMGDQMRKNMTKALGDPDKALLQKLGTLQIAGRNCDNYLVEQQGKSMRMSEEVCIDTSLKPPTGTSPSGQKMQALAGEMMEGPLAGIQSAGQKELAAIPGTPLKRVLKSGVKGMMNVLSFGKGKSATEEEAILVKEGPIEPSVFKLPEGYKMVNQAEELQRQMKGAQEKLDGMMNPK